MRYPEAMPAVLLVLLACRLGAAPSSEASPIDVGLAERLAFVASPHPPREERPPNLVLLLADDLGLMDLSLYGGARHQTRHMDAIGVEGVRFDEGYITSPICAPSRAGLLTGRYQQRFGFELITHDRYARGALGRLFGRWVAEGDGWELATDTRPPPPDEVLRQGLPPGEITLAEILGRRGYATAIIGKWHLGTSAEQTPNARGFDYQYGFYEAHTLYAATGRPDMVEHRLDLFADEHQWRMGRHGNCAIRRDGEEVLDEAYLTDSLAEEAVNWIRAHKDEPFFLYVPFLAPHAPYQVPRSYYDLHADEPDEGRRVYAAMLHSLDDAVGRVLAAIDAEGLTEETLVVLLSDNGAAAYTHVADNDPLRGGKLTHLEGGVNVPFLMRWPGVLPAGARYAEPVSSLDVFATFVDAAGAELPADRPYDGVSLLPFLRGEVAGAPHEALFWRAGTSLAVRQGRHKLLLDELTGQIALYDLVADKEERHDLAPDLPERVAELREALDAWRRELVAPSWPPVMRYRYEEGGQSWVFPL